MATLGRGGSDLTATLLGRALGAREVSLWKDVPGLLTADPRVVPDARVIPQLHLREAAELAYYGAKVLHPRALIPVAGRPIPVFVRPFAEPDAPGTEISARRTLDKYPVKALSAATGQALITVAGNGMLGVPGIAARTFEALHREGISVSLISQSSSEQSICFSVPGQRRQAGARAPARGVPRRDRAQGDRRHRRAGRPGDGRGGRPRHGRAPRHRGARVRGARRGGHQHRRDRAGLVGAEHLVRRRGQGRGAGAARGARRVPARRRSAAARRRAPRTATSSCSASARSDARWRASWPSAREGAGGKRQRRQQAAPGRRHRPQRLRVRAGRPDRARGRRAGGRQAGGARPGGRARAGGAPRPADALALLASTRWRTRSWST